jgi:hypothetical protein
MYFNAFYQYTDDQRPTYKAPERTTVVLKFPCNPSVIGALVGRKWSRVKQLSEDFTSRFPGFTIDVTHDGIAFNVMMANFSDGVAFVTNTFGEEISLANHGIYIHPQFVGRMIGKGGHNLRDIEAGAGCKCTIYHDNVFWVRFTCDTPVSDRQNAIDYIEERMFDYANYLEDRLVDIDTESVDADTGSEAWSTSGSDSEVSTTASEESTEYSVDNHFQNRVFNSRC